jgi:hypothetical protein
MTALGIFILDLALKFEKARQEGEALLKGPPSVVPRAVLLGEESNQEILLLMFVPREFRVGPEWHIILLLIMGRMDTISLETLLAMEAPPGIPSVGNVLVVM